MTIEEQLAQALADAARLRESIGDFLEFKRGHTERGGIENLHAALAATDSQRWLDGKLAEARSDGWERAVLAWSEAFARRGTAFRSDLEPSATLADHDARVAAEARKGVRFESLNEAWLFLTSRSAFLGLDGIDYRDCREAFVALAATEPKP